MINIKFKKIYELSTELQQKYYRQDYERLLQIDNNIGTFNEFVENENTKLKNISSDKNQNLNDIYISKDNIQKDNITFELYLIHYIHTDPTMLDKNYHVLPLTEKEIFEYGAIVSLTDDNGFYDISGVFGGIENNKEDAILKYNTLKDMIEKKSIIELLDEIEDSILQQLNY